MRFSIKRNNGSTRSRLMALACIAVAALMWPGRGLARPAEEEDKAEERTVTTARDAFTYLNLRALEILKRTTRLDVLDYWDADSIYKATNAMKGESWIENCTPDYMRVRLTPVSTLELKMLPTKKDGMLTMVIYTVGGEAQAEDSRIIFTDEKLHLVETEKHFKTPKIERFFDIPKGSLTSMKEIKEMIPFPTVVYEASPTDYSIKARLTVGEYMNIDDYNIVKLFLRPEVSMTWNEKKRRFE